jgi:hypothetical protein
MALIVVPHDSRSTVSVTFQLDVSQSCAQRLRRMGRLVSVRGRSADVTANHLWEAYQAVAKYHPDDMLGEETLTISPASASAA